MSADACCSGDRRSAASAAAAAGGGRLDAWYMDGLDDDQRRPHRLRPNRPVSVDQLEKLGVFHWKVTVPPD